MAVQLQKIAAPKKIKCALASAMEATTGSSRTQQKMSFCGQGSIRLSSNNLSNLSVVSLEREAQEALQQAAKEDDAIIKWKIKEALSDDADAAVDVTVDVWNPWPWTYVLDKIGSTMVRLKIPGKRVSKSLLRS
mmetsp:Transcript_904/g.1567  ORF Transcript_904/g.1567 Transcript_904/m.1567 type:complete len:134 (+) Transcript_904:248-649(+)